MIMYSNLRKLRTRLACILFCILQNSSAFDSRWLIRRLEPNSYNCGSNPSKFSALLYESPYRCGNALHYGQLSKSLENYSKPNNALPSNMVREPDNVSSNSVMVTRPIRTRIVDSKSRYRKISSSTSRRKPEYKSSSEKSIIQSSEQFMNDVVMRQEEVIGPSASGSPAMNGEIVDSNINVKKIQDEEGEKDVKTFNSEISNTDSKKSEQSERTTEEEEAVQDVEREALRRQGLPIGPRGKERLVYEGDYIVHENFGVCRFKRAYTTTGNGKNWEVIELDFADGSIEVPRNESMLLTRLRGADAIETTLSRLSNKSQWLRDKEKVSKKVRTQATNIVKLYAARSVMRRTPCKPDGLDFEAFCNEFPYPPTPDQAQCMEDVKNDMIMRKQPMDRLLCGDVGFGKTEVAIRAVYRAIRNGRQVAFLAPTTILAAQHYRTLRHRLPESMSVELLRQSRTRTVIDTKARIATGDVDVVVGTHTLLGRKVVFKNLGLLVVDEEQKFGVKQKERLKAVSTGIDVLTLSATPIPRTMHMSLTGIRDLSIIRSPPEGRQNITTYIMKSSDEVVQRALARELRRNGQAFYVVPRISDIAEAVSRLERLAPKASVVVAHSRIKDVEDRVLNFTLGIGDVLIATSIIESGIDMPNVNSIIIQDAYMFGLSQLYQMRGRVGRSYDAAYTYLLYTSKESLTDNAKQRLNAMRELSTLGSGFELANRDMEIRGVGNVLGTDQSGDVGNIGFELYMNMLGDALIDVRESFVQSVMQCHIDLGMDPTEYGSVPTGYMPLDSIGYQVHRLHVNPNYDTLVTIAKEWVREYGTLLPETRKLFAYHHVLAACRHIGVSSVTLENPTTAKLSGPDVYPNLWEPLIRSSLEPAQRERLIMDNDTTVMVDLSGIDRQNWIDTLLEILLPISRYVKNRRHSK